MADQKLGRDVGVAWQDGDFVQLFRPPVASQDRITRLLVAEHLGVTGSSHGNGRTRAMSGDQGPSNAKLAWDAANVAMDGVVVFLSASAVMGAITLIAASGATVGTACLVAFAIVEAANSAFMAYADGRMLLAEAEDKATGTTRREDALKEREWYHLASTWGPLIALPAVGKDILDLRKLKNLGAGLEEARKEINNALGVLAVEWVQKGDPEVLQLMKYLSAETRQIEHRAEEAAKDVLKILWLSTPADLWGFFNDYINYPDILDGMESDFRPLMNSVNGWVSSHELAALSASPHSYSNPIAAVAAIIPRPDRIVHKTTNYIKFHVVTAKQVKKK